MLCVRPKSPTSWWTPCGWTRGTMRETYGSGTRALARLAQVIERVRYDGLDLKRLYTR